ncbi:hypothetical protein ACFFQF_24075 [Haladaptatus pallidirubidus]|uniref:Uncharacterized protein n=1 Tax=Haladaptatus pallidirubidus TaxID=1008152 RepID=A0AAV3UIS7_9EURY|nr:hypothetical protein [Haladaptatus pallidirubidus]
MAVRGTLALRIFFYATVGVATIGTGLVISDQLLGTTYWPNTAEYGQNLFIFALMIYVLTPDRDITERWQWIATVSLSGSIWLMVIAAYTDLESILIVVSFILILLGVRVGAHRKYRQWANPPAQH